MPAHRHDIATRHIAAAGACIAIAVALVVGVIVLALQQAGAPPDGARDPRPDIALEGVPLESAPQPDLQRYLAQKQQRLESAGWVDAPAGIAHVPIDTAMALMSERGLRAVPAPEERPR